MAKKVNKFADAMNEALMGRTEEAAPMNPPEEVIEPFNQYADASPVSAEEDDPRNDPSIVTEEEMNRMFNIPQDSSRKKGGTDVETICISIPSDILKRLNVLCKVKDTNRSKYITSLIKAEVTANEDIYQSYIKLFGNKK